jgi:hypothetical protein
MLIDESELPIEALHTIERQFESVDILQRLEGVQAA